MNYYEESFEPNVLYMPCGGTAYFDESSGISHRCETCGAVIGSIGQPTLCKSIESKYRNWELLGGKGWDYINGGLK